MTQPDRMKPIIILPEGEMSADNLKALRDNWLCVVECKNPASVKFLDPIPSAAERTKVEDAAIALSRKVLNPGFWTQDSTRQNMAGHFVDILLKGTRLDPEPPRAEVERDIFDDAKADELRKIAREEARAERAAKKEADRKARIEADRLVAEAKAKKAAEPARFDPPKPAAGK